jgi:hypothetical protein
MKLRGLSGNPKKGPRVFVKKDKEFECSSYLST